jgi:CRP-like cAMP-binding protein
MVFGRNEKLDVDWLASIPFFDGFSSEELSAVSALGERSQVGAGVELIDQGRIGQSCHVIVEGTAEVYIAGEFVTALGPGAMVGEMALVDHRPRTASVLARTDLVLVTFDTAAFQRLLDRSPNARQRVMALLESRLSENAVRNVDRGPVDPS